MAKQKQLIRSFILIIFTLLLASNVCAKNSSTGLILTINSAIGPATQDYVHRGLTQATDQHASLVILMLDTPGGLDKSMRGIIQDIIASPIPVIAYVAPSGARAASAGTYIMYASHIAAMAPGTNLGAATPVNLTAPDETPTDLGKKSPINKPPSTTLEKKATSDAIAYIKSLAQLRQRNVDFAEKAVANAASISAQEALHLHVIDYIAKDISDLLQQVNGKSVNILGQSQILNTRDLTLQTVPHDWRSQLLEIITDPSVAYVLLLIGIYGLFFEFVNPGFVLPGVMGAIALLLALYAFQLLPINYAGIGLIFLSIAFMIAEAYAPTFGVLGFGGIIAFIIGSVMLMDAPGYAVAWSIIIMMSLASAVFFFVVFNIVLRARQRKIVSGREDLLHATGEVIKDFEQHGQIRIQGEIWEAYSATPLKKGQKVKVIDIEGLKMMVAPIK